MKQIREIKMGVSFVIGTPGRLRDLIDQKVLDLSTCHSVVLDEADRMLDMGFREDMVYIIGKTHKERQTLFFSATLSPEIRKLTEQYLKDPVFISVISGETAKNIEQDVIRYKGSEERLQKLHEVLKRDGSDKVLIFRERKHHVDELEKDLKRAGLKAGAIHGDKRSRERIRILDSFKRDQINILIATDVAARGLDIPDVTHVINFDVPQTYDTYVHRIGRTGRAGASGIAFSFCDQEELEYLKDIHKLIGKSIPVNEAHPYPMSPAAMVRKTEPAKPNSGQRHHQSPGHRDGKRFGGNRSGGHRR